MPQDPSKPAGCVKFGFPTAASFPGQHVQEMFGMKPSRNRPEMVRWATSCEETPFCC